jgi:16S rRNA (cytosine1402-N4)-methyltransferase
VADDVGHDPVLINECLALLDLRPGEVVVDCTLGRGGHALKLGEAVGAGGTLIGLDADSRNLAFAAGRLAGLPCRVHAVHANFAEFPEVLTDLELGGVDALLADLGVSTNQLFDPAYGLSISNDMPLDMRLDPRLDTTAADLCNTLSEKRLADLIYQNADERHSRRIARYIVGRRPLKTTADLANAVLRASGGRRQKIHPATRTFQALRMAVNRERENLDALLASLPTVLNPGGRAGIISFHSLEDRPVKQGFLALQQAGGFERLTRKPITPGDEELTSNPRSRSAKLRGVRRQI